MAMEMRLKMKNRSQRYNINRRRPSHGHKYTKYKVCLSIMTVICIKQHLATFAAQFMKKLSSTEAELKKSVAYKKSVEYLFQITSKKMKLHTLCIIKPI